MLESTLVIALRTSAFEPYAGHLPVMGLAARVFAGRL
jgi:hypothetical protein